MKKNIESIFPLSSSQKGMLIESLSGKKKELHMEQVLWKIEGDLNVSAFQASWQSLLDRHAGLRTVFIWDELQEPVQVTLKKVDLKIDFIDLRHETTSDQTIRLEKYRQEDHVDNFELSKAPILRLKMFHIRDSEYCFLWSHHHILMDGWCTALLQNELMSFYLFHSDQAEINLAPALPYGAYMKWLSKQDKNKAQQVWSQYLINFSNSNPIGRLEENYSDNRDHEGAGLLQKNLPPSSLESLRSLARGFRVTQSQILQAIWAVMLSSYSGDRDIVFGATVSGRPHDLEGVENSVGLYINSVPRRFLIDSDNMSFKDFLDQAVSTQEKLKDFEFMSAGEIQECSAFSDGKSIYDSLLVFQNYPGSEENDSVFPFSIEEEESKGASTHYPLVLMVSAKESLGLKLIFQKSRFEESELLYFSKHFEEILRALDKDESLSVMQLKSSIAVDEIPMYYQYQIKKNDIVPAVTEEEKKMASVWSSVLGDIEFGIHDHFFEVGGHSLLAVKLSKALEETYHRKFPLRDLFQNGTISELLLSLESKRTSEILPLVPIRIEDSMTMKQAPLFCIHPAGGNVLCYFDLAHELVGDSSVYGLQSPGLEENESCIDSVENMASYYLDTIAKLGLKEPVRLLGWSFGGIVAFEMARQLKAAGKDVSQLIIIDVYETTKFPDDLKSKSTAQLLIDIFSQDLPLSLAVLEGLDFDQQLLKVLEEGKKVGVFEETFSLVDAKRFWDVFENNSRAERAYRTKDYFGSGLLIKSSNRDSKKQESLGWFSYFQDALDVVSLEGNHQELIRKPLVKELADLVKYKGPQESSLYSTLELI